MDIAFVSNVVYPFVTGGAEKRIYEIGTRLAADGHSVTVYARQFWDGPSVTSYEGMTLRAVAPAADLYTDDRRSISEAIDFAVRLAIPLRRQITQQKHDVVVASVFPYFPVISSSLASARTDAALVTTWHEVWGSYWKEYLGRLAPFGQSVERITARIPQDAIAVSEVTADRLAQIGRKRDAISVVPNGIDIDKIQTAPLPERTYDVLFAGRLIADKNVDILLDAFDSVAESYDATLGILGEGPELDRLQSQTQKLQHGDRVTFLGFLEEYESVLGHMRAAQVFASPSTREGFGITFAEAMAADCTVIAANHPESAAREVIGDAGFLVDPTVEDVSSALASALAGNRPSGDVVARARMYDWDIVAEQARDVYERAIQDSR
mgnify:FL=1